MWKPLSKPNNPLVSSMICNWKCHYATVIPPKFIFGISQGANGQSHWKRGNGYKGNNLNPSFDHHRKLQSLVKENKFVEAEEMFQSMKTEDFLVDLKVYNIMMKAYGKQHKLDTMMALLEEMIKEQEQPDMITYTIIMDTLGKMGQIEKMMQYFEQIKANADMEVYTVVMDGLASHGKSEDVFRFLNELYSRQIHPDVFVFTTAISGLGKKGDIPSMMKLFDQMKQRKVIPNIYTYTSMIHALAKTGNVNEMTEIYNMVIENQIQPTQMMFLDILNAFSKKGNTIAMEKYFLLIQKNRIPLDVSIFTVMMDGYHKIGDFDSCWRKFQEMVNCKIQPDHFTIAILINCCGIHNKTHLIHSLLHDKEYVDTIILDIGVYETVILALMRNGKVEEAIEYLDEMKMKGFDWTIRTCQNFVTQMRPKDVPKSIRNNWDDVRNKLEKKKKREPLNEIEKKMFQQFIFNLKMKRKEEFGG